MKTKLFKASIVVLAVALAAVVARGEENDESELTLVSLETVDATKPAVRRASQAVEPPKLEPPVAPPEFRSQATDPTPANDVQPVSAPESIEPLAIDEFPLGDECEECRQPGNAFRRAQVSPMVSKSSLHRVSGGMCVRNCELCADGIECLSLDCPEREPYRFFGDNCWLDCRGIDVYGWLDFGVTYNQHSPDDGFNGPVLPNDRDGEFQLNQAYLVLEKLADNQGCGLAIGGRIDLLYGTDSRLATSRGLETDRNFNDHWNGGRFYGLALPQAYVDVALDDWNVRLGHFYTILGYELTQSTENFFYSHTYSMYYGEPSSHTGMLVSKPIGCGVELMGGFHRGWDNWEDYPGANQLDFLEGVTWKSDDGRTSIAVAGTQGKESDALGGFAPRSLYSVVVKHQLTDQLSYVFQHDGGRQSRGVRGGANTARPARWNSVNQLLIYQINCCWSTAFRLEAFDDDGGVRVRGLGDGNQSNGSYDGVFWQATWGVNWKPNANVTLRPEIRYDWFNGVQGVNPFDGGAAADQFTAAVDAVIQW
jgi:hypothetical protein